MKNVLLGTARQTPFFYALTILFGTYFAGYGMNTLNETLYTLQVGVIGFFGILALIGNILWLSTPSRELNMDFVKIRK
jgi:hypothetical protein